jgi:uncharacterized damage-inducible protein DinB
VTPALARTFARYNRWMNERLYGSCATLGDAERKRDAGAFFKSIHGTLNHLLVADSVWMGRFEGPAFVPSSLAQELHAEFVDLREARAAMDARIEAWAGSLTDAELAGTLHYTSIVGPAPRTCAMTLAVAHFFNHQTHHRGQLTTLLFQAGVDPGVTDLIVVPAQAGT